MNTPDILQTPTSEAQATNVQWQKGLVSRADRESRLGQHGATLWFTGLSGSGKSTIACALEQALARCCALAYRLDGDNLRLGLNRDLGFSATDRVENIRRVGEVAKLFADAGLIVLSSFISPYRSDRDRVREIHTLDGLPFIEVFVDCPLTVAEARDPKGLYRKARTGEIVHFTGIDAPYEAPLRPEVHLRTDEMSVEEEVAVLLEVLIQRRLVEGNIEGG